jgi:hypothetical protein
MAFNPTKSQDFLFSQWQSSDIMPRAIVQGVYDNTFTPPWKPGSETSEVEDIFGEKLRGTKFFPLLFGSMFGSMFKAVKNT